MNTNIQNALYSFGFALVSACVVLAGRNTFPPLALFVSVVAFCVCVITGTVSVVRQIREKQDEAKNNKKVK